MSTEPQPITALSLARPPSDPIMQCYALMTAGCFMVLLGIVAAGSLLPGDNQSLALGAAPGLLLTIGALVALSICWYRGDR